MRIFVLTLMLLLGACSNDNSLMTPPTSIQPTAFDELILEILDETRATPQPVSIEDKQFVFPDDPAAFASLFPLNT